MLREKTGNQDGIISPISGWGLWFYWIVATCLGGAVGMVITAFLQIPALVFGVVMLVLGFQHWTWPTVYLVFQVVVFLSVGWAQQLVLMGTVLPIEKSVRWAVITALGGAIASLINHQLGITLAPSGPENIPQYGLFALGMQPRLLNINDWVFISVIDGAIVGCVQCIVLLYYSTRAIIWILATLVSSAVTVFWTRFLREEVLGQVLNVSETAGMIGLIGGIGVIGDVVGAIADFIIGVPTWMVYAVITGSALVWLSRNPSTKSVK